MDAVCTFCGKNVLQEVREGENLFHLYCFVLYKRQASPFRDQQVASRALFAKKALGEPKPNVR